MSTPFVIPYVGSWASKADYDAEQARVGEGWSKCQRPTYDDELIHASPSVEGSALEAACRRAGAYFDASDLRRTAVGVLVESGRTDAVGRGLSTEQLVERAIAVTGHDVRGEIPGEWASSETDPERLSDPFNNKRSPRTQWEANGSMGRGHWVNREAARQSAYQREDSNMKSRTEYAGYLGDPQRGTVARVDSERRDDPRNDHERLDDECKRTDAAREEMLRANRSAGRTDGHYVAAGGRAKGG